MPSLDRRAAGAIARSLDVAEDAILSQLQLSAPRLERPGSDPEARSERLEILPRQSQSGKPTNLREDLDVAVRRKPPFAERLFELDHRVHSDEHCLEWLDDRFDLLYVFPADRERVARSLKSRDTPEPLLHLEVSRVEPRPFRRIVPELPAEHHEERADRNDVSLLRDHRRTSKLGRELITALPRFLGECRRGEKQKHTNESY